MMQMDRYKIHRVVECIKQYDFEFEVPEVVENLQGVLANYGLVDADLTDDEEVLLMIELIPLAEQFEFGEVDYLVLQAEVVI
jgi:hypothetical protein